ncbi:MAG TPA: SMI1/KNR4 family protein [Polyangiaceae bacterium]
MDSDLSEALSTLKQSFQNRGIRATFGRADQELISVLRIKLKLPRRYREFLLEADPLDVETRTPSERVRLFPAARLEEEQLAFADGPSRQEGKKPEGKSSGWRASWVVVAHSTLLGDPYFLDTSLPDAEGDCPVFTAMSGTEQWKSRLCASSFALFVRILGLGMEVAGGFAEEDLDIDDESVFREALGPKIRQYDPAALKAGHWT